MEQQTFEYYIERYTVGKLSPAEWNELRVLIKKPENIEALKAIMDQQLLDSENGGYETITETLLATLLTAINDEKTASSPSVQSVKRVSLLRSGWFRYAAAVILLLFGIGAYVWNQKLKVKNENLRAAAGPVKKDIAPGREGAVLTLADGSQVLLDSVKNSVVALQDGVTARVIDGALVYEGNGNEMVYNVMSTPNGRQYHVTLPDGTQVWLNAASSIRYPIVFAENERKVKITGEAYFEVAKDKTKPFSVDVDGKSSVQVLGTGFNINSYGDEGDIKTTLIDGSVKVNQQVILKPGQQALQPLSVEAIAASSGQRAGDAAGIIVKSNADLSQALAWKNGLFSFNNAGLRSAMRQLERWYNIKVEYERVDPDITLKGEMYRNVNLSNVLEFLRKMGVQFRMEGNVLTVF